MWVGGAGPALRAVPEAAGMLPQALLTEAVPAANVLQDDTSETCRTAAVALTVAVCNSNAPALMMCRCQGFEKDVSFCQACQPGTQGMEKSCLRAQHRTRLALLNQVNEIV
jgi:hypothetical protein